MKTTVPVLCLAVLLCVHAASADEEAAVPVLDTAGFWRMHYTLRLPVLLREGKVVDLVDVATHRYVSPPAWIRHDTPYPPTDWMKPDFNDGSWERLSGTLVTTMTYWKQATDGPSPFWALVCARGKFAVKDPARAAPLVLDLEYRGGVVVYLNGERIAHGHMSENGTGGVEELAVPTAPDEQTPRRLTCTLPTAHLRRGVNVLAVEVHRAPLREDEIILNSTKWPQGVVVPRAPCAVERIRLSAPKSAADAVVPNVTRPKGFQVWNSNTLQMDFDLDWGDPNETLRPVRIVGTPNGAFSGKVVVGSDREIKGLRAAVSALTQTDGRGRIPASRLTLRYARPHGTDFAANFRYPASVERLDALDDAPPAVVPVRVSDPVMVSSWTGEGKDRRRVTTCMSLSSPGVTPVFGAVCPVWVTVNVPADTPPGEYGGTLTLTADGEAPVEVPVTVTVCGWRLPDPREYATWADVIQSPETLALGYKVPLWSDEHFRLIERSLTLLGQAGTKTVYLRMICETNLGNAETLVRWIPTGRDGAYTHDFSAFDRYMDLVEKHVGKPPVVCLYVWDKFLERMASRGQWEPKDQKAALSELEGKGPEVTQVDPATGRTSKLQLPPYADPKAKELWRPVSEYIRRRMKAHGMSDSLMVGVMCDYMPSEKAFNDLNDIYPGVRWVSQAHPPPHKNVAGHVGYASSVYGGTPYRDPATQRLYGWKQPELHAHFWRRTRNDWPVTTFRFMGEMTLLRGYRGFARMGGDFFPVLEDKRGRVVGAIPARYLKSFWNNLNINVNLLAPGETGPVATARFEMMREGIQECEARIFIERALTDPDKSGLRAKLGEELAARVQDVLDERARFIRRGISTYVASGHYEDWAMYEASWWTAPAVLGSHWYISSHWESRAGELYSAAADVAQKLNN